MWALSRQGRRLHQAITDCAHQAGGLRPDVTALDISWMIEQFARTAPPTAQHYEQRWQSPPAPE